MSFSKQVFSRQKQGLDGFRKILNSYLDLQKDYSEAEPDDYAFAHTEMTFVSMLSTAATLNKWTSICEFGVNKIWVEDNRYNSDGRGDIYLTKKGLNFGIYGEAKRLWLNMSKKRRPTDRWKSLILDTINHANEDIWRTVRDRKNVDESDCGISIGCLTFSVTDKDQCPNEIMGQIWDFLKKCQDEHARPLIDALAMITVDEINPEWKPEYPIGSILTISSFIEKDVHE